MPRARVSWFVTVQSVVWVGAMDSTSNSQNSISHLWVKIDSLAIVISPILSPGLIIPLAEIRVCVGAFVGEISVGVAHAARITTNNRLDSKQPGFFMVILPRVQDGSG